MDTSAQSVDPDEMPHDVAFHLGLHLFAEVGTIVWDRNL